VFAESADTGMRSPVEQAFRWLWDQKDVGTVLSGMSSMEQLAEDIDYAGRSGVGCIAETDRALFKRAKELYEELRPVACTECRYCMPCPHGVDIPRNFQILNQLHMFGNEQHASYTYNSAMDEECRASECIACGECEPQCPQQIPIIDSLKRVRSELEK
jgi:predicted aldo/keto reductase-like oxidoreductase